VPEEGEVHPQLAQAGLTGAVGNQKAISGSKAAKRSSGGSTGGRKRLGKSLTEIDGGS
jgi:hypothetical protein